MSIDACAQRLSMCLPATQALPRAALIDGPSAPTASAFSVNSRALQQRILESGLVAKADLRASLSAIRLRHSEGTPVELARELVRRKLLTRYQARVLYHEKCDPLVLGQYVILDEVGRGGVGRVFKAEHRGLKRTVALKIPSIESAKIPASIERFRREVMVAGRLNHPNIVSAYDAGEINGRPFLVMEYVEGCSLDELVRDQGSLSIRSAVNYVLQAARGLAFAHRAGIIHRDVKPGNLIVDHQRTIKVLDLGLARILTPSSASQVLHMTRTGIAMGTVDFMAPEQAVDTRHADGRADIYSLGATLFYLLTGKPLFGGSSVIERLLAHRDQPIPSLREARPDAPAGLEVILSRMLAKEAESRYQSMTAVMAALEDYSVSRPTPINRKKSIEEVDDALNDFLKGISNASTELTVERTQRIRETSKRQGGRSWLWFLK